MLSVTGSHPLRFPSREKSTPPTPPHGISPPLHTEGCPFSPCLSLPVCAQSASSSYRQVYTVVSPTGALHRPTQSQASKAGRVHEGPTWHRVPVWAGHWGWAAWTHTLAFPLTTFESLSKPLSLCATSLLGNIRIRRTLSFESCCDDNTVLHCP